MGDLDPSKARQAIKQGLAPLDQRIATLKSKKVSRAWERFNQDATSKLLSGDITIDEWKSALGQFGGLAASNVKDPSVAAQITQDVNGAAIAAEGAFDPPSSMTWLIFAGVGAAALAYWWMKKEESQREVPIATPEIISGSRRSKKPTAQIEEAEPEDAEFEEI